LPGPKTILIVDDDVSIRRVLEVKLRRHGFEVITGKDGLEALDLIRDLKPDVVITDLNMPAVDGETLCRITNPLKKERNFLTIVLTGSVSPQGRKWLAEMENTQFVEKPFSPSRLAASLQLYFTSGDKRSASL
jgi:CheY-like chemotaxis protein